MPATASRWIVDARTDVAWFILPALTGYLCLYVNAAFGVSSFLIWWFWQLGFNGPHFYATVSRTYLDREEWRQRRGVLLGSLLWFLVGPLAIWVSIVTRSMGPFVVFWMFQVVWAYYHVVRQHYGFMALYQKLNGEPDGRANRADYWIFHVLMFSPVVAWFLCYPEFRSLMGWSALQSRTEGVVVGVIVGVLVVVAVAYVLKEVARYVRTRQLNLPKMALLAAYVPLHTVLLLSPAVTGAYDILLFNAAVTLPHDLQYVAIVWFYNSNRYVANTSSASTHGWATVANASPRRFAILGIVFSAFTLYTRFFFEGQPAPFGFAQYAGANRVLGEMFRVSDLVAAAWIGMVFHHQYLDQKIWKISRDRTLARDLRLDEPPGPPGRAVAVAASR